MSKLSIIVPIYNVEKYLEECLSSLLNQGLSDYEVILVNDGSTDSSKEIMDRFAKKHPKFLAYTKPNGGLGNARNFGIQKSTGEYLTFLDSDDIIPANSYSKMMGIIERTGSDFITGNVIRFDSLKRFPSSLHQKIFSRKIERTTIKENPELIYDTISCNKIFRTSFWKKNKFEFPEQMLFEDIPVTIPAHLVAESVDMYDEIMYEWRARDEGEGASITQQRTDLKNMSDRMKALNMVESFLKSNEDVDEITRSNFYFKAISLDIKLYMNVLPRTSREYQETFVNEVNKFIENIDSQLFEGIRVSERIKYAIIREKNVDKLMDFLDYYVEEGYLEKPFKTEQAQWSYRYKYIDLLPKDQRYALSEFEMVTRIENVQWTQKDLCITGFAYIKELDANRKKDILGKASLVADGRIVYSTPIRLIKRTDVAMNRGVDGDFRMPLKRVYNYKYTGYEITLPNDVWSQVSTGQETKIVVEISNQGIVRDAILADPRSYLARPKYRIFNDQLVYPKYNLKRELEFNVQTLENKITEITFLGDKLLFKGVNFTNRLPKIGMINYEEKNLVYFGDFKTSGSDFSVALSLSKLSSESRRSGIFYLYDYSLGKTPIFLNSEILYQDPIVLNNNLNVSFDIGKMGNGALQIMPVHPFLDTISFSRDYLEIKVRVSKIKSWEIESKELILRKGTKKITVNLVEEVEKDNMSTLSYKIRYSDLEEHFIDVSGIAIRMKIRSSEVSVFADREGFDSEKKIVNGVKTELYRDGKILKLKVLTNFTWINRGPRRQDIIKKLVYPLFRKLPVSKKIFVFSSYWGTKFDCNPRAMYEYIEARNEAKKLIWFVDKKSIEIDGQAKVVQNGTILYYYYLARAGFLFNNVNFPDIYQKRSKAIEIQTMHGTPLKTVGLDVRDAMNKRQRQKYINRSKRWDYLTVPSDYVEEISKSAYQSDAKTLKSGYPRNDYLFNIDPEEINRLKIELKIPKKKKVILYAPTWRRRGPIDLPMNLERLNQVLGEEYVLLVKLHHFNTLKPNKFIDNKNIFDVGYFQDIRSLYALSDVMITDYSSTMFDFGIQGKPMIFYVYDYQSYIENDRGLYIDFKEEAPGPLCFSLDELLTSIKDIDSINTNFSDKIQNFRKKFIEYDKGNASEYIYKTIVERRNRL